MPKYDAFGREIGEDSLEGLGWTSGGAVTPAPPTPPEPEPAAPQAPPPVSFGPPPPPPPGSPPPAAAPPLSTRPRRRGGPPGVRLMSRLITLAVFIGIAATVVPSLSSNFKDATGIDINVSPDNTPIPFPGSDPEKPAKPPVGLESRSLIRRPALKRALADLQRRKLGRPKSLRVAPDRIDAELLTANGRLRSVQVNTTDDFRQFSVTGPVFRSLGSMSWSKIDPGAPQRIVKAAAERISKPASKVDYLVALDFDGQVLWSVFFKGGQSFQADARGKITRRVN
jgi:hypothetical protein